ncbi:hypothetical protein LCGC14_2820000, partial [marine sediment metagenome]
LNQLGDQLKIDLVADKIGLIIQAHSSQTANIHENQDSSANVLSGADERGILFSDGDIDINSVYIGSNAGNISHTNARNNIGIGPSVLSNVTTGDENVGIGFQALLDLTTGFANVAVGREALGNLIGGWENTAIGYQALFTATEGRRNFGLGRAVCHNLTIGENNVGISYQALYYNVTGDNNIAIGSQAGQGASGNSNSNNVFIGFQSGFLIETGSSNVFLGNLAGSKQTTLSNLFIVDNRTRADIATELTNSILYGVMAAAPANQTLRINANILGSVGAKIGDGGSTNYVNIAPDGELTLVGTAMVMISIDLEPVLATRPAANPPGEGTEDNFQTHDFNASTDESVYFHLELPHDYAAAGTIHVHFDFFVDTAPASAQSVVWGVEYKKQSIGDNFDFGAGTTIG